MTARPHTVYGDPVAHRDGTVTLNGTPIGTVRRDEHGTWESTTPDGAVAYDGRRSTALVRLAARHAKAGRPRCPRCNAVVTSPVPTGQWCSDCDTADAI